jgi:hypothetical protein
MMTPMQMPAQGPGFVISSDQKEMTKFKAVISNGISKAS